MKSTVLLSAGLLALISCGDKTASTPAAPPPARVVVEPVRTTTAVYYDEYPATVTPLDQVDLRPQVSGFITGIHFEDGQRVRKGALLYSIDAQLYTANYDQAVANLRVQEANLARAEKDAQRYRELAEKDAIAQQLVDNAEATLEVARKQRDAAKANISGVQTNVRYTRIYAPFTGVIGISQVKKGAPVTAGQTLLNTISSDGELAVDFSVDQKEIFRFQELKNSKGADSVFTLRFGDRIYPHPGKLSLLDRAVDPTTGTLKARLVFPNPDNQLRPGMNTSVRIKNTTGENDLLIPFKAVVEQLGEYFVYVPGDSNKVSQTKVVLGRQAGKDIIIKEGLDKEDSVVTQGIQLLREGTVIESVPAITN